jgi:hypothetical protein
MRSVQVQHCRSRAIDFLEGMKLLKDDLSEFRYSSALLGIHGAISYCDALRIGLGSVEISSDDHRKAVRELRILLNNRRFEKLQGVGHLERLLSNKSKIAYSREASDRNDVEQIVQHAERFAAWAETTGKALKIEGWIDA